jgi:hypothetical protein
LPTSHHSLGHSQTRARTHQRAFRVCLCMFFANYAIDRQSSSFSGTLVQPVPIAIMGPSGRVCASVFICCSLVKFHWSPRVPMHGPPWDPTQLQRRLLCQKTFLPPQVPKLSTGFQELPWLPIDAHATPPDPVGFDRSCQIFIVLHGFPQPPGAFHSFPWAYMASHGLRGFQALVQVPAGM